MVTAITQFYRIAKVHKVYLKERVQYEQVERKN